MTVTCHNCSVSLPESDVFCPFCGERLSGSPIREVTVQKKPDLGTSAVVPLPTLTDTVDSRVPAKRRPQRRWYRRKLFVAFATIVALIVMGMVLGTVYVDRQFREINTINTPLPIIAGNVFDEDASSEITTDPAQQVLALAESGDSGEFVITSDESGVSAVQAPGSAGTPTQTSDASTGATAELSLVDSTPTSDAPSHTVRFSLKPVQESSGGSLNILLMGVDAGSGEEIDVGVRPDSLSVLHLDGESRSCRILSIPRDTRTELPGYGLTKINHALAVGGIPYQQLVVEQLLGIKIDHYGLIDFAGIVGVVDVVGGVTVDNPQDFEHEGFTFAQGKITLDGEEALAYARYRYGPDGDFGRQQRQQQIIRGLLSETSGMDVVRGANRLLGSVQGHFKTDLSPTEMISIANDYRSGCTAETLDTAGIEGIIETHMDPMLNLNLSYVILEPGEVISKVAWLLERD